MKELFSKLRNYEIRIRKAITAQMQGDYHSVFKGSGLEFDDVRPYQYGDDTRHIDWNVSAKGNGTYLKTFREEKEQNVFFIVDVSASQNIGKDAQRKIDVSNEICGVLTISALKEDSSVGLLCFSDAKEKYIKPNKGIRHAYQLISTLFRLQPSSVKTDLNKAMATALSIIKRKSIIIIISDFVDENYERNLKSLAGKHDLIVIHIADNRETQFPKLGIVPIFEPETGKTFWANTASGDFRKNLDSYYAESRKSIEQLCRQNNADYLHVTTSEDFVPQLIKLFRVRNRVRK